MNHQPVTCVFCGAATYTDDLGDLLAHLMPTERGQGIYRCKEGFHRKNVKPKESADGA